MIWSSLPGLVYILARVENSICGTVRAQDIVSNDCLKPDSGINEPEVGGLCEHSGIVP